MLYSHLIFLGYAMLPSRSHSHGTLVFLGWIRAWQLRHNLIVPEAADARSHLPFPEAPAIHAFPYPSLEAIVPALSRGSYC